MTAGRKVAPLSSSLLHFCPQHHGLLQPRLKSASTDTLVAELRTHTLSHALTTQQRSTDRLCVGVARDQIVSIGVFFHGVAVHAKARKQGIIGTCGQQRDAVASRGGGMRAHRQEATSRG